MSTDTPIHDEAGTRLLVAACRSYRKHFGPSAVEAAESDALGKLIEACRACHAWHIAEEQNIGSFHDKMDLCEYSHWLTAEALGFGDGTVFEGINRIGLAPGPAVGFANADRDTMRSFVDAILAGDTDVRLALSLIPQQEAHPNG